MLDEKEIALAIKKWHDLRTIESKMVNQVENMETN